MDKSLNNNEVSKGNTKQAIILAAGFGSGFIPVTYDTPLGLISINGEKIIERLIKQLHTAQIKDITVVTGNLASQYDYLSKKFGVKLVFNDLYKESKSLRSLLCSKKDLKNTYIITSNTYLKENVFTKEIKDRSLSFKSSEGNLAFLSKSSADLVMTKVSKLSQDKIDNLTWNEVVFKVLDIEVLDSEDIIEVSNLEALVHLDNQVLKNLNNEILDTIVKVFKVDYNDISGIQPMVKGMTNLSFLFNVNGGRYVFRVPGRGTDLLITRSQESDVYQSIKDLNISDEIVYIDPEKGYKITKYYPEIRTIDPYNQEEIKLAFKKVKKLHDANLKVDHHFDILERIDHYLSICKDLNVNFTEEYLDVSKSVSVLIDFIKSEDRPLRLCHIDPVPANFLVFKDKSVKLIDWEYSGMSDPIIDIAMFGIYQEYSSRQMDNLLEIYLDKPPTVYERKLYYSYVGLTSYLWYLWTIYKEVSGDFYGDYAALQLNYAKKYSKKFMELADEK